MNVNPYLSFEGRCDEAIGFYKKAVGAEVKMLMRFKDMPPSCPEGSIPPGSENKVLHAELRIGDSTVFATDGHGQGQLKFHGISLSVSASNDAEAAKLFSALGEGGQVTMPLGKTFFASSFGMLNDRFGVSWMIVAQP